MKTVGDVELALVAVCFAIRATKGGVVHWTEHWTARLSLNVETACHSEKGDEADNRFHCEIMCMFQSK